MSQSMPSMPPNHLVPDREASPDKTRPDLDMTLADRHLEITRKEYMPLLLHGYVVVIDIPLPLHDYVAVIAHSAPPLRLSTRPWPLRLRYGTQDGTAIWLRVTVFPHDSQILGALGLLKPFATSPLTLTRPSMHFWCP
jgi:hypothetical protein